jgi:hypothetical protein
MTCNDCKENPSIAYIRVDVANVAIVACKHHLDLFFQEYINEQKK